jgi:hypothetical protein
LARGTAAIVTADNARRFGLRLRGRERGRGLGGWLFSLENSALSLIDGNALFQQFFEGFDLLEVQQRFLNLVLEAFIKHRALGFRVKVEGRDNLLEFGRVRGD